MTDHGRAVLLGDLHFPWHDRRALDLALAAIRQGKPDLVVQIGDLYDNFSFSRFDKDPNVEKPRVEMERARQQALDMWFDIRAFAPGARLIQLQGNHDSERLEKLSLRLAPALYDLVSQKAQELMTFPGVETRPAYRDHVDVKVQGERWRLTHGIFSSTLAHVKHHLTNVALGHLHRGEVVPFRQYTGLNVGYLADPGAPVFRYRQTLVNDWTQGIGVIDEQGPRFMNRRTLSRLTKGGS